MRKKIAWLGLSAAAIVAVVGMRAEEPIPAGIEGTYRLVSRDLPDGTTVEPPAIQGLITFANGYRNFNIYWEGPEGEPFSISYVARYEFTDEEYRESNVYLMVNDEIGDAGVSYDLSETSGASPVTRADGRIELDLPLHDEPHVVFDGDRLTASREGEFVDHWEKVD